MRFEGTRTIHAPIVPVWQALRDPEVLEVLIPHCVRIERQPGYRPESDADFTLSFELDVPQSEGGHGGLIIGWLEVDRQRPPHHLSLTLTLNDALIFMHVEGALDLTARDGGRATEVRYVVEAKVPGMRGVGWSASVHDQAELLINAMLDELNRLLPTTDDADITPISGNGHQRISAAQVLAETPRGTVVLLPATEVPAPTQGMLRRVEFNRERRVARHQRNIITVATLGTIAVASAAYAVWEWSRRGHVWQRAVFEA